MSCAIYDKETKVAYPYELYGKKIWIIIDRNVTEPGTNPIPDKCKINIAVIDAKSKAFVSVPGDELEQIMAIIMWHEGRLHGTSAEAAVNRKKNPPTRWEEILDE
jgi:hypothetical protein